VLQVQWLHVSVTLATNGPDDGRKGDRNM